MSKFERFESQTAEELSKLWKFFVSACFNMILLTLLANLDFQRNAFFQGIHDHFPGGQYILSGKYDEFTRAWYLGVGDSILLLMLIQIVWPQVMDLLFWVPFKFIMRKCRGPKAILQSDLNEYYEGRNFELWDRYAYSLANVFFGLAFSSGLPLMYPLLLGYFLVRYWLDKILRMLSPIFSPKIVLRFYKKPVAYGPTISRRAYHILPVAIIIHLLLSAFAFTTSEIFPHSIPAVQTTVVSGVTTRVYKTTMIPLKERVPSTRLTFE